ncbi:MAG: hypothetical protein ACMZ66_02445 [Thalassospira sp.]|uniref:hypothetical protein n=1 Tax=Thalassospira sp. TaxID=1912094 RepID=UPI003A83CCB1
MSEFTKSLAALYSRFAQKSSEDTGPQSHSTQGFCRYQQMGHFTCDIPDAHPSEIHDQLADAYAQDIGLPILFPPILTRSQGCQRKQLQPNSPKQLASQNDQGTITAAAKP